jgi:endonuclease G
VTSKKKRKPSHRSPSRKHPHPICVTLALLLGLSLHSCADMPAQRVATVGTGLAHFATELEMAVREVGTPATPATQATPSTSTGHDAFSECPQFFAKGQSPVAAPRRSQRALCYDAFAILHSGESKTAVFVAERLNKASVADANEKRTNNFFADARLRAAERATLEDYRGSGFDRGHMAPAGDMPSAQAMAQSFSLANMVPQAPELNRGVWAKSVEAATRKYAARASGDVYVITGPVYAPSIAQSPGIGPGQVRVPKYLFKLVYDEEKNRAWAHWHLNADAARGAKPISYAELVKRTGMEFLPGVSPRE